MKKLLVNLFWFLRFHEIARLLFQKNKTTIIYYHDIEATLFDKHLTYLKCKYNVISLEDYVKNRVKPNLKYRLVITFDDGHVNNHALLEVLKKHQIPCTIFLVSNLINTNKHFWFKWEKLDSQVKNELKKIANSERIKRLYEEFGFDENKEQPVTHALRISQIMEMSPWVSFQSHTHTHPCLNRCTPYESKFEIEQSKNHIEELLKNDVFSLAFPNGDYERKEIEHAKHAGYTCVLTSKGYYNSFNFHEFELKRLSVNDFSTIKELALRASGVYLFMKKFI